VAVDNLADRQPGTGVGGVKVMSRRLSRWVATGSLVLGAGFLGSGPTTALADSDPHTCSGSSVQAPGVLAGGSYSSVVVQGFCAVNAGVAHVRGNLTVLAGGVLAAAFAVNDPAGSGTSHLVVDGNLVVGNGAVALLGCDPVEFPCLDDPNPTSPTLSTPVKVGGDIAARGALGVVMHHGTVGGDFVATGGGGGTSCNPTGVFALFNSPAFTAIEFSRIGGDVRVTRYNSCWLGIENNHLGGNVRLVNNQLADPDAIEIQANSIKHDIVCLNNSMVWDSGDGPNGLFPRTPAPNTVHGDRVGQCVLASPTSAGGPSGPGPF
jgi:hypothetical protein